MAKDVIIVKDDLRQYRNIYAEIQGEQEQIPLTRFLFKLNIQIGSMQRDLSKLKSESEPKLVRLSDQKDKVSVLETKKKPHLSTTSKPLLQDDSNNDNEDFEPDPDSEHMKMIRELNKNLRDAETDND